MKDLLLALFAMVILYETQTPNKDAYAALKSPNLKKFFEMIPSLKSTCAAFLSGDFNAFEQISVDLRSFIVVYKKDPNSRASITNLLSAFALWMRNGSPGAMKNIKDFSASSVFPVWVSTSFVTEVGDQSSVRNKLRSVMKKMTGEASTGFDTNEAAAAAKIKHPDLYKEYLLLRKDFNKIWKDFLSNFVRASGKKTVPYEDLMKAMKKAGIEHNLPDGFTGRTDAVGKWYSEFDEPLTGTPPGRNMFPRVLMNPAYTQGSSVWVYVNIRTDGTKSNNYTYTRSTGRSNASEKFEHVKAFMKVVEKIRGKWVQQIKVFDDKKIVSVACVVLELLYQFSARIGGRAFGVCTLQRKHYTPTKTGFILRYRGKDNVDTRHVYQGSDPLSKLVIKIMSYLVADKQPDDRIFTVNTSSGTKPVSPAQVNTVFKQMGAVGVTVHKLRTYHGNRIFQAQVEKIYKKFPAIKEPSQALSLLKVAATEVGKALNHVRTLADGSTKVTPATAMSAYIDPEFQKEFFQHYGLPIPKYLEGPVVIDSSVKSSKRSMLLTIDAGDLIDTKPAKMKEVPKPVNDTGTSDKPKEKSDEEDFGVIPQLKDMKAPVPDKEDSDEDLEKEGNEQDAKKEKLRKALEKSAEKFSHSLTYGGTDDDNLSPRSKVFDNVLVEDRFKGTEAP